MFNGKIKLADLKVKSFVTILDNEQAAHAQGGIFNIKGKRTTSDRYNWSVTVIDVRHSEGIFMGGRRSTVGVL